MHLSYFIVGVLYQGILLSTCLRSRLFANQQHLARLGGGLCCRTRGARAEFSVPRCSRNRRAAMADRCLSLAQRNDSEGISLRVARMH